MRSASTRLRRAGFTLVEVLVATAISVILVLGVVRIASDSLRAYDNAVAMASVTATARTVLDTIETDLQSAILREDGNPWIECMPSRNEGGNEDLNLGTNIARGADMQLMFFGTPSDRDRVKPGKGYQDPIKGDVCAIRYQLRLRNPLPTELQGDATTDRAYCLTRTIINSEDTFNLTLPSTQTDNGKGLYESYWKIGPTSPNGSAVDQKSTAPQKYFPADLLANNVIGFTPIFIFKATKTNTDGTQTPFQYYITPEPENATQDPAMGLSTGADLTAYASPDNPTRQPGPDNRFRSNLKIAATWCARDSIGIKNSDLAALDIGGPKTSGRLCAVVIAIVVIDDSGADKLRTLMNQNNDNPKIDAAEFDKVYAEHSRVFTRRINLPGR